MFYLPGSEFGSDADTLLNAPENNALKNNAVKNNGPIISIASRPSFFGIQLIR